MRKSTLRAAALAAALLPAAALARAVDEPLSPRGLTRQPIQPQQQPGVPDTPPTSGNWIKVLIYGVEVPFFVKNGFPLPPYPPCWKAARPTEPCIKDGTTPPRP